MSDFTSNFWSIYISAITIGGIIACLALLWISGKTKAMTSSDNTTGHVWDGDLREMNNPLPRWWVGLFIITCVFALIYLYLYPGLGNYQGSLKWTQTGQFDREVQRGNEQVAPIYAGFEGKSVQALAQDPTAMAIGDRLFMNNCAQCHGSDARGSKGFPNLTDANWTWGGTAEQIHETIVNGRTGIMTPMAAAVGTGEDVRNLANYVMSLSNGPHDSVRANLGKSKFTVCAACHGPDGKGNQALGSPDLTRGIFVYGPAVESHVTDMITNGRTGVMPAWDGKFTPAQINVLAAYVWGKGGGVADAKAAAPVAANAGASAVSSGDVASVMVDNGVVRFFFATGKADIASGADTALADVVAGIKSGKKAVISGYVDSTGNADQNAELAKQRAFAVRDQLKALGAAAEQIELKEPENIEAGSGGQARRVEVSLV
ncbi:MAG: cytochrome-c oxidase, cbb3-type subunit III [Ottowia sp.]|jgi:cytochrome c oxidase cbb3-type subunit 3|nr:cytochrome-c oxidase, cbb3-type subunit III [Ottowia sp.]